MNEEYYALFNKDTDKLVFKSIYETKVDAKESLKAMIEHMSKLALSQKDSINDKDSIKIFKNTLKNSKICKLVRVE